MMSERFGFNSSESNATSPFSETGAETNAESRVERALKDIALGAIKKRFPAEVVGDLKLVSGDEDDDGASQALLFSKPGNTFAREILYRVSVFPSGDVQVSRLEPKTSFEDTLKGKRYRKKQGR